MLTWAALFAAGCAAIAVVGLVLWRSALRRVAPRDGSWQERAAAVQRGLTHDLGAPLAALAVLLAGLGATVAVLWPLGHAAKLGQSRVDVPLFRFAQERDHHRSLTSISKVLTQMGNRYEVKIVCVVAAVALTVAWRKRGWWVPVVVIAAAFGVEKYTQKVLGRVVDRGHPPTTLGTYPSGGVGRLLAIYGTILFLVLVTWPPRRRAVRFGAWLLLATAAFVEGYTRIYLLKHWFTDVVGGWVFGSLLLVVLVSATAVLTQHRQGRGAVRTATAAQPRRTDPDSESVSHPDRVGSRPAVPGAAAG